MNLLQAIDGSIVKWESICFEGKDGLPCTLCFYSDSKGDDNCQSCPLDYGMSGICQKYWGLTSDYNMMCNPMKAGCYGDYIMLLNIYMVKIYETERQGH